MSKLEIGCEVEIANFNGRYKIIDIKGKIIKIKFGSLLMNISYDDIIRLYKKKNLTFFPVDKSKKYFSYNPTIDLHGNNVEESLTILDAWLEEGLKIGCKYFKIIHGKGTGVLREHVKKILSKKKILKSSYEAEQGGVTIVEL